MSPEIIKGNCHEDGRGFLFHNNDFDISDIRRFFIIENKSTAILRCWRGHRVEKRWFSAITGSFCIELIQIDNWENPSKNKVRQRFVIDSEKLNILHVPEGYVSSIQSLQESSKLLVFANYLLGEILDDYSFDVNYFD